MQNENICDDWYCSIRINPEIGNLQNFCTQLIYLITNIIIMIQTKLAIGYIYSVKTKPLEDKKTYLPFLEVVKVATLGPCCIAQTSTTPFLGA